MCGIVGRLALPPAHTLDLSAAVACLHHRGPDAQGVLNLGWAALGHTRLAILDLDPRSNQPFVSPDGRWALVYNGEIYNYVELREELHAAGAWSFHTSSDTEVVLAALVTWGNSAVKRFNGMWALCLLDTQLNTAFLSRDRFGIKPLFYQGQPDGSLAFASRIDALRKISDVRAEPSLEHLRGYLTYGMSDWGSDTFYEGIKELRPGHNLLVDTAGRRGIVQYYEPPKVDPAAPTDSDELESLIDDSIRLQLRSDVPVAITLSGGLDSSIIAALTSRQTPDVLAVTATIQGHRDDEGEAARRLCQALGIEWMPIEINVDRLDLEQFQRVTDAHDGPTQSPAAVAMDSIMGELRARGYLVALEGQGADELFGGYGPMLSPYVMGDQLRALDVSGAIETGRNFARAFGNGTAVRSTARSLIPGLHSAYLRSFGVSRAFGPALAELSMGKTGAERRWNMGADEALDQQRDVVLRSLLTYGDRMSMAHGVEARQPYLDVRVAEYAARIPAAQMIKGGQGKAQLRDIARRVLPISDPINGPKRGFVMPVRQWMNQPDVRATLLDGVAVQNGIYKASGITALLERNASHDSPLIALAIFRLLMGEFFFRTGTAIDLRSTSGGASIDVRDAHLNAAASPDIP